MSVDVEIVLPDVDSTEVLVEVLHPEIVVEAAGPYVIEVTATGANPNHGQLIGLEDDDHPQYLTDARGDAKYAEIDHSHTAGEIGSEPAGSVAAHDATPDAHANMRGIATPVNVNASAAAVGVGTSFAREDHRHQVLSGNPVALGAANAPGFSMALARADHVHIFPTAADVGADPAGTMTAHVNAPDPHPQYLTQAEGDTYLTQAEGDTLYVNASGDTMSGPLTAPDVSVDAAQGSIATQSFKTGGSIRWQLRRLGSAESGGNAGSDLQIRPHDDAGNPAAAALTIIRSTGLASVKGDPTAALGVVTKQYADGLLTTHLAAPDPHPQYLTNAELAAALPPETDANRNTGYGGGTPNPFNVGSFDNAVLGQSMLGLVTTGARNSGVGANALGALTTGSNNTVLGFRAGAAITTGNSNFALGPYALDAVTTASENIAIGHQSMRGAVATNSNIGIGSYALNALAAGGPNVAIGGSALMAQVTGYYNVAVGPASLASSTGRYNTAVGYNTGGANFVGQEFATLLGASTSVYAAGSGNGPTAVGYNAKAHTNATALGANTEARGTASTAIGYGAVATIDNQIMLGTATEKVTVPGSLSLGNVVGNRIYLYDTTYGLGIQSGELASFVGTAGDFFTWKFGSSSGTEWARMSQAGLQLKTGALTLLANPTNPLEAAPKQYVDTRVLKTGDTMTGLLTVQNLGVGASPNFGADYPGIEVPGRGVFMIGSGGDKSVYAIAYDALASVVLRPGSGAAKQFSVQSDRVTSNTPIYLPADPTQLLQAATKQYADGLITTHTGLADPHTQYLNTTRGDARYSLLSHTHPSTTDFQYTYDSPSTMADPGVGKVRTDTAAGTPSTQVAFNDITSRGIDATNTFNSLTMGDLIYFQELGNAANWGRYAVSGTPMNNGTWWLIPVSGIEQHGAAIAKNQEVLVRFTYGAGGGGSGGLISQATADAKYVDVAGDTMTGPLNVLAPSQGTHAVTKTYADALITTHTGLADPHPIYLTSAEGSAAYAALAHSHTITDLPTTAANPTTILPDAAGSPGVGTQVSRADHTHAIQAAAPSANLTATTTNAEGSATAFSRSDHSHAITANVAPSADASTAQIGTSVALARADHQHPYPTAANVGAAATVHTHVIGDLPTGTSGTTVAIGNHTHTGVYEVSGAVATHDALTTAHSALRGTATPVADDAGTAAVGTANKFAREDHKHSITVAAPVALGAANAAGSAASLARSDHVHIYPTAVQVGALPTGGGTMTGSITGTYFIGTGVTLTGAAGTALNVGYQTAGVNRWTFGKAPGAESGANSGANFTIARWDDAGAWIDNPISIGRSDGIVSFNNQVWLGQATPTAGNHAASKTYTDTKIGKTGGTMTGDLNFDTAVGDDVGVVLKSAGLSRWLFGKSPDPEIGSNQGSEFILGRYNDAGDWVDNPLAVLRGNGQVIIKNPLWLTTTVPTDGHHAASKEYVDGKINGAIWAQTTPPTVTVPPTGYPLWLDTDEPEVSVALGNRNRIINGDMSVNQRGFASSAVDGYTLDRWFKSSSGGTVTVSAGSPLLGELPESARTYLRLAVSGQSAGHWALISQPIESVRTLSGKQVTVSFWARAASGTPKVAPKLEQNFGTGGSPSAQVDTFLTPVTISTSWTRYSITGTVPSITGKTVGTGNNDKLGISLITSEGTGGSGIGAQAATIDIWGVQVEEGAVATPYEQRRYADELLAAQRYFWRIQGTADVAYQGYAGIGSGNATSATGAFVSVTLPTAMRKPAVTTSGTVVFNGTAEKVITGVTTVYWSPLSPTTCFLDFATSGLVAAQTVVAYTSRSTAGYIDFNAEF